MFKLCRILFTSVITFITLVIACVLFYQGKQSFGFVLCGTSAIFLCISAWLHYSQVVRPMHQLVELIQANRNEFGELATTDSGCESDESILLWLSQRLQATCDDKSKLRAGYEHDHLLVTQVTNELNNVRLYSDHLIAIDEESEFDPANIRTAFRQSEAAADYATQTFEKIYMSINALGTGYNDVRQHATSLRGDTETSMTLVGQTRQQISDLSSKANEITEVTQSIADIASMTQLLALNASIEAARAGESGRGFAVVAEEVKKLAEQTNNATARITSISDAILASSTLSSGSMEEIDDRIQRVGETIFSVVDNIEGQWKDVQNLLGQMGQTAGTVSGLKGILQNSEQELESHFVMLDGIYQFGKESSKAITTLAQIMKIDVLPPHAKSAPDNNPQLTELPCATSATAEKQLSSALT
ncbi:MAG: hypothetical protein GJ680_13930 [Alteromonadaceae bacterium]|nr:hypothetical protein [Alteromonadaceae bacterium]